ncbi:hypothetical protein C1752_01047 [Acaryochloris thomasi RCC1774]|uniref:Uncharacterized protein n=1 Tax=Acaryochloris thomasi RCC1774 TaxID=1764569 RepID=A0A2W1K563_9CYAN|nr:hypothetical protein [Acaryochloris thomasi]PZD74897.1 hypothetical protein C1752_01047 [Acaryochloris thomasi RCC1774]
MNVTKTLVSGCILGSTVIGAAVLGLSSSAQAGTLVTCGPGGAAYIVETVPAGCRHLSATSAPKHAPDNAVKASKLGFTFTASSPKEESAQPVAAETEGKSKTQPLALR